MKRYELTLVLAGSTSEAKRKAITSRFEKLIESLKGRVVDTTLWGKKPLFYSIKKNTEGLYYFLQIELSPDQAPVLNREVEIDEEVIRHLLVVAGKTGNGGRETVMKPVEHARTVSEGNGNVTEKRTPKRASKPKPKDATKK